MSQQENKISEEGIAFVKTATAAPDFMATELDGIPDGYNGRSICKKDYYYETIEAVAGEATYIIVTPTAAVSHWNTTTPLNADWTNNQIVTSKLYPDAGTIFRGSTFPASAGEQKTNSSVVDRARIVGMSAELVCLNNAFNRYGSIATFKTPLSHTISNDNASSSGIVERYGVTGVTGLTKAQLSSETMIGPVADGSYSVSMNRESEFLWQDVLDNQGLNSETEGLFDSGGFTSSKAIFRGPIVAWDNGFDTIVFRIDVPSGTTNQSFVLKTWKVFEYQPVYNSLLYSMAGLSAEKNLGSLQLYSEIERQLPVGVPARDNPDFWTTVLGLVNETSDILSIVPGPIGQVAKGVHAISSDRKSVV